MIAALDAIIHLEERFFLHNDIKIANFIYYKGDFLLGDFDLSCLIKNFEDLPKDNILE